MEATRKLLKHSESDVKSGKSSDRVVVFSVAVLLTSVLR